MLLLCLAVLNRKKLNHSAEDLFICIGYKKEYLQVNEYIGTCIVRHLVGHGLILGLVMVGENRNAARGLG